MQQRAMVWAVMPVKQLNLAKSRLASCLGARRAEFARCLMLHTLDALRASGVFDGIVVVTPDAHVAAHAEAHGAIVAADRGNSLNEACSLGLAAAQALGAELTVFVHADLALLRAADIRALLASYHTACAAAGTPLLGLVRCKEGDGTNIVFCDRATSFVPHFGPRSFARHAAETGYCALLNEHAAFDIDTEIDMAALVLQYSRMDPSDPIAQMLHDEHVRQDILRRCEVAQTGSHLVGKQL